MSVSCPFLHLKRRTCPGCGKNFDKRYFASLKSEYFVRGRWVCATGQDSSATTLQPVDASGSPEQENTSERIEEVKRQRLSGDFIAENPQIQPIDNDCNNASRSNNADNGGPELWNEDLTEILEDFAIEEDDIQSHEDSPSSFQSKFVKWICTFLCVWHITFCIPDSALENILLFLHALFQLFEERIGLHVGIAILFPTTLYSLWTLMGIKKDKFIKFVVCPRCHTLYNFDDCIRVFAGRKVSKKCSVVEFPNHPQRSRRQPCGTQLLKTVELQNGRQRFYPYRVYCYRPLKDALTDMLQRPGFEEACEAWRKRNIPDGLLGDVQDGKLWTEFVDDGSSPFFQFPRRYGLMLNVDWFSLFKRSKYSVGAVYVTIMNLPRKERFKRENVILLGIIPNCKVEPPTNSFLKPLVEELKDLYTNGLDLKTHSSPNNSLNVKAALLCASCDIPAIRKVLGFKGHGANRGCSKCFRLFPGPIGAKNYSGFTRNTWPKRDDESHKIQIEKIKRCNTQTARNDLQTEFGCSFSVLLELPYFSVVRHHVIDPMHNLFLGSAKRMFEIWCDFDLINSKSLKEIEKRIQDVDVSTDVGRLPTKIAECQSSFTAEEWMNWTIIYSLYALNGILPKEQLDCWRNFVLACRILCRTFVSLADIERADTFLLNFCKGVEQLYGEQVVTPNMHLHAHLADCVKDYGPIHSFWLFSFERYNGVLESLPTNNRALEIQLMRRFMKGDFMLNVKYPEEIGTTCLGPLIAKMHEQSYCATSTSSRDVLQAVDLATGALTGKSWEKCDVITLLPPCNRIILNELDIGLLCMVYNKLYPESRINARDVLPSSIRYGSITLTGEIIGCSEGRGKRKSYILASWVGLNGVIAEDTTPRPGKVMYFIDHCLKIADGTMKHHVFAHVQWYQKHDSRGIYGDGVEVWSSMFENTGPASFIPVQRIASRFFPITQKLRGETIIIVTPKQREIHV